MTQIDTTEYSADTILRVLIARAGGPIVRNHPHAQPLIRTFRDLTKDWKGNSDVYVLPTKIWIQEDQIWYFTITLIQILQTIIKSYVRHESVSTLNNITLFTFQTISLYSTSYKNNQCFITLKNIRSSQFIILMIQKLCNQVLVLRLWFK
nr:PREDICTED: uncharacterized protein LOC105663447 [Megachile rotundata]